MAVDLTIFERDVAAAEIDLPVTFTFNSIAYQGSRAPIDDAHRMMDEGYSQLYSLQLVVRLAVFGNATPPDKEDLITIDTVEYRITDISRSQDGVIATYTLKQSI